MKTPSILKIAVWLTAGCFLLTVPAMGASGTSSGDTQVDPIVSDLLLAKEIDIHLEKKTEPGKDEDMKLEKTMPEAEQPAPEEFEDDPFASDKADIAEEQEDRAEGFNRAMHDVNDTIYQYFFRPLAKGYREVIPEEGRIAVGNAFDNLKSPAKLVSSAIQGDTDKSGRVVSRFLINSTVGLGGFLDVAEQEYGIHNVNEDFSQALASQGVEQGDYLVLPVFGPSTTRDAVGMVVDSALNPASYFGIGFLANAAMNTTERVNQTSFIVDDIDQLNESAIDPYESQRHFYLEIREKQVNE